MNEYQMRNKLLNNGHTWEEAEAELDDWASDEYDREKDYQAEEKANAKQS
jgi:hypothetical protein